MANGKKSFLLYTDVHHTVKKLTDIQAGKLFKHILSYVNDENPELNDLILDIAFEPIKQNLKRDLRKYEEIREKRSFAGKTSADKRQQVLTHVNTIKHDEQVLTHSTVNDNVNDIVNVNKKRFTPPRIEEIESYFSENGYTKESARKAFNYYSCANWKDSKGNQVKNWKQKMQGVWFKEENRIKSSNIQSITIQDSATYK